MFPTHWVRHKQAIIEPISINGAILTFITGEPVSMHPVIQANGFKRLRNGWAKFGLDVTALSQLPHMELYEVGQSFFDSLDDTVTNRSLSVPMRLQDSIKELWRSKQDALLMHLRCEFGADLTTGQCSTIIEQALVGTLRPESFELWGLAADALAKESQAIPFEVMSFCSTYNVKLFSQAASTEDESEYNLFNRGDSITWETTQGELASGRSVRNMRSSDKGIWVVQAPLWVDGYALASPLWINRESIIDLPDTDLNLQADSQTLETVNEFSVNDQETLEETVALPKQFLEAEQEVLFSKVDEVLGDKRYWPYLLFMDTMNTTDLTLKHDYIDQVASLFERAAGHRIEPPPDVCEKINGLSSTLKTLSKQYLPHESIYFEPVICAEGSRCDMALKLRLDAVSHTIQALSWEKEKGTELLLDELAMTLNYRISHFDSIYYTRTGEIPLEIVRSSKDFLRRNATSDIQANRKLAANYSHYSDLQKTILHIAMAADAQGLEPVEKNVTSEIPIAITDDIKEGVFLLGIEEYSEQFVLGITYDDLIDNQISTQASDHPAISFKRLALWHMDSHGEKHLVFYQAVDDIAFKAIQNYAAEYSDVFDETDRIKPSLKTSSAFGVPDFSDNFTISLVRTLKAYCEASDLPNVVQKVLQVVGQQEQTLVNANDHAKAVEDFKQHVLNTRDDEHADWRMLLQNQISVFYHKTRPNPTKSGLAHLQREVERTFLRAIDSSRMIDATVVRLTPTKAWCSHIVQDNFTELRDTALKARVTGELNYSLKSSTVIDFLPLVDNELYQRLSQPLERADVFGKQDAKNKGRDQGLYKDVGKVFGLALKEIQSKGMRSDQLARVSEMLANMTADQRALVVSRDKLWQRKSMAELKENGFSPRAALLYDIMRSSLPTKPSDMLSSTCFKFLLLNNAYSKNLYKELKEASQHDTGSRQEWLPRLNNALKESYKAAILAANARPSDFSTSHRGYVSGLGRLYLSPNNGISEYRALSRPLEIKRFGKTFDLETLGWDELEKATAVTRTAPANRRNNVVTGEIERIGENYRNGQSVTPEDFLRTFAFSGVEFGNWTSVDEREKNVNYAYDSLIDFAKVLNVDPLTLSMGGKIGLCFGSRGRGGANSAAAHYNSTTGEINLTRDKGDGFLAHEYFHAIANHFGATGVGANVDYSEFVGAAVKSGQDTPEQPNLGNLRVDLQKSFYNLMTAILLEPQDTGPDVEMNLSKYTNVSTFVLDAQKLDSAYGKSNTPYYASHAELFARGMEHWLANRLEENGQKNTYLVGEKTGLEYPREQQAKAIAHFANEFFESLESTAKLVSHPFLGEVELPILNSKNTSILAVSADELEPLANSELSRLFGDLKPELLMSDDAFYAGAYDASKRLIRLDKAGAGLDTIYHEAWHACEHLLLTATIREDMRRFFESPSVVSALVDEMKLRGYSDDSIQSAVSNPQEAQAYAFELWAIHGVRMTEFTEDYRKVKRFADDSLSVGKLLEANNIDRVFERFFGGELAVYIEEAKTAKVLTESFVNHVVSNNAPEPTTQIQPHM